MQRRDRKRQRVSESFKMKLAQGERAQRAWSTKVEARALAAGRGEEIDVT